MNFLHFGLRANFVEKSKNWNRINSLGYVETEIAKFDRLSSFGKSIGWLKSEVLQNFNKIEMYHFKPWVCIILL